MHTRVNGGAVIGLDGAPICVEVDISSGMPKTTIVGLPDAAVDEARERVRSAIRNAGAGFPTKRVTVNLAPAHIRKEGAGYDLPIAVGMLVATGQICESAVQDTLFLGELALDGELRHVRGVLSVAAARARRVGPAHRRAQGRRRGSLADRRHRGGGRRLPPRLDRNRHRRTSALGRDLALGSPDRIGSRHEVRRSRPSRTCADRSMSSAPWRWPPPVDITC